MSPIAQTNIVHIRESNQLESGRSYWVQEKDNLNLIQIVKCDTNLGSGAKFLGDGIMPVWAYQGNNQAFERWNIVGPVPAVTKEIFYELVNRAVIHLHIESSVLKDLETIAKIQSTDVGTVIRGALNQSLVNLTKENETT